MAVVVANGRSPRVIAAGQQQLRPFRQFERRRHYIRQTAETRSLQPVATMIQRGGQTALDVGRLCDFGQPRLCEGGSGRCLD
jgi:hypothetical protein